MKNKIFGIIGVLLFVAAVVIGQFTDFENADVMAISLAAFALASVVLGVVAKYKEKGGLNWKGYLIIALAVLGGIFVCLGNLSSSILETVSGLVLALLSVFLAIMKSKKE